MMTYEETLEYMFNSLPMYHRIGKAAYKADITNTVEMMEHLGHPETRFRSIHVAGTNGKGSVSHFLCSVLMNCTKPEGGNDNRTALKVGLYTSPHLVDFRERIRINGEMIPQEEVTSFITEHKDFFDSHQLSFFEMTVGLAFWYFAKEQVDVAVVEVGMGGRLDSTNVIQPELCVITNISFDHTQFLGDTLSKIAAEKAGIIKPGVPVVIGQTQPETQPVFLTKAAEQNAPITFADQHFSIVSRPESTPVELYFDAYRDGTLAHPNLFSPLAGNYQMKNLATMLQAVEQLQNKGFHIPEEALRKGIAQVVASTGLHGRWECFGKAPLLICETAHNEDGVREMLGKLEQIDYDTLHIIYGCVNDKDFGHILQLIGHVGQGHPTNYYYTQPSVPRGLAVDILASKATELGFEGPSFPQVGQAIEHARTLAAPTDLILVTGSIFLIADAVAFLRR